MSHACYYLRMLTSRPTLATLNDTFRASRETSDFVLTVEYRVGRYGLQISRDGRRSRGQGGKLLHLMVATVIAAIKPDYDWRPYCAESAYVGRTAPRAQAQMARDRQIADHGTHGHRCRQPKVGDVLVARQVCVDRNAVGLGAYDPSQADPAAIDCNNCARRQFGENPELRARVEAAAKLERAAAKAADPTPTCFWCGDRRPRTTATAKGEVLPCSTCKEDMETIWWVETTGVSCKY